MRAASTGGGRIRVDHLNGVDVCFTGMFNTLIIRHQDIAGEVAAVTQLLAVVKINIANMSLCRDRRGGDALMVIETDHRLRPAQVDALRRLSPVLSVTYYEKEDEADASFDTADH